MYKLIAIPAFTDNYLWLLHDGSNALVVDPGDADAVLHVLRENDLQLKQILVTHHHADHTGGVNALREACGAVVYGPATERIPKPFLPLAGVGVAGISIAVSLPSAPPPEAEAADEE